VGDLLTHRSEDLFELGWVAVPEEVKIFRRAVQVPLPNQKGIRPLQHEPILGTRLPDAIQEPFQGKARQERLMALRAPGGSLLSLENG
jgi:hypothetical protein